MKAILLMVSTLIVSCTSPYPGIVDKPDLSGNPIKNDDGYLMLAQRIKKYELQLDIKSSELQKQKYVASDVAFLGTVTSVVAAASGAITTALYSGGVGIGGGLVTQRYNYDAQLNNYRSAREKLNCMYRAMLEIPGEELTMLQQNKNGAVTRILQPYISAVIYDIYFELETKQSVVELNTPDLTALTKLFTDYKKTREFVDTATKNGTHPLLGQEDTALIPLTENIRTKIGICKITPGAAPQS